MLSLSFTWHKFKHIFCIFLQEKYLKILLEYKENVSIFNVNSFSKIKANNQKSVAYKGLFMLL